MTVSCQCNMQYIPYKEIERIQERTKNKYNSLSFEEKKKRQEYNKECFKKQPIEKQQELKEKARQYHRNRYYNLMITVN